MFFGIVRWTYNQVVSILKNKVLRDKRLEKLDPKTNKPLTLLKYLRSEVVNEDSPAMQQNSWLKEVGYDIRDAALQDALTAYTTGLKKLTDKTISQFKLQFRSRKKSTSESLYLRSRWINQKENKPRLLDIKWPKTNSPMTLFLSNGAKQQVKIEKDCRLQRTNRNEYYLCVPIEYEKPAVSMVENQDHEKNTGLRVCSIDPGVRTFQTIYDITNGQLIEVAPRDIGKIMRLSCHIDKMISQKDRQMRSKMKYRISRVIKRTRNRIRNLIDEVHKQLAKFLAVSYDLIILPEFETSHMIRKLNRKIGSKSARSMVTWAHYRFRQRVICKARQFGSKVVLVDESYTSKTCSSCGNIKHDLGAAKQYRCLTCDICIDRDANGAKNIFLKNYEALEISVSNYGA